MSAREILLRVKGDGRNFLLEHEAKSFVADYGIPVTRIKLAKSEDEAVRFANEIGFPVVLKIASPQVIHKSDVGGVKVNLRSEDDVRRAYR
ncbi:MAG: acetate--CoA ligase family protein, partial [Candidatus Korarchaeum sp.]